MCVIAGGNLEPSNTTLTSMPISVDGTGSQFLIYTNSMNSKKKDHKFHDHYFYNYEKHDNRNENHSGIMLIGIPSDRNICLYDNAELKNLNSATEMLSDNLIKYDDQKLSMRNSFDVSTNESSIKSIVRQVGNYKISIVKDLERFEDSIDWVQFLKPNDFQERISVFRDKKLFPDMQNRKWSYLVAEAYSPIENDGFGISFPLMNNTIYYPTCHEVSNAYEYSVTLNLYSQNKINSMPFMLDNNVQYNDYSNKIYSIDKNRLKVFSGTTPMSYSINGINYDTGVPIKVEINTNNVNFFTTKVRCWAKNQNIYLS